MSLKKINCISVLEKDNQRKGINNNMSIEEMFYGNDFKTEDMLLGKYECENDFIKSVCSIDTLTGELVGFFFNIDKPKSWNHGSHYIYDNENNLIPIEIEMVEGKEKYSVPLDTTKII